MKTLAPTAGCGRCACMSFPDRRHRSLLADVPSPGPRKLHIGCMKAAHPNMGGNAVGFVGLITIVHSDLQPDSQTSSHRVLTLAERSCWQISQHGSHS
jgi:hypothetical protein